MKVTSDEFEEIFEKLSNLLCSDSVVFISVDLEMTGIQSFDKSGRNRKDDSPESRYLKMVPVATKYTTVQIGLCIYCTNEYGLIAHPFTFYVFPEGGLDITLNLSSVDFLKKCGMDFNKWILKGISYANDSEEEFLVKKYNISQTESQSTSLSQNNIYNTNTNNNPIVLTKSSDIEFMDRQKANLINTLNDNSTDKFIFEYCNPYLRKAIYQYMEKNHPNVTMTRTSEGNLCAMKLSDKQRGHHNQQLAEDNLKNFNRSLGFKRLWKKLISCKKPIVGHNCLFDLLFLYRCLVAPLPSDFTQFKEKIINLFPSIYDTKYITESGILPGTVLENTTLGPLYQRMVVDNQQSAEHLLVPCSFAPGLDQYASEDQQQLHEAGYDAYCTGRIFAQSLLILSQGTTPEGNNGSGTTTEDNRIASLVKGLARAKEVAENRLFLTQSLYHMDLRPGHPNGWLKFEGTIVHVADFAPTVTTEDIFKGCCNSLTGIERGAVEVIWINDTQVLVAIQLPAIDITSLQQNLEQSLNCKIQSFEKYQESLKEPGPLPSTSQPIHSHTPNGTTTPQPPLGKEVEPTDDGQGGAPIPRKVRKQSKSKKIEAIIEDIPSAPEEGLRYSLRKRQKISYK